MLSVSVAINPPEILCPAIIFLLGAPNKANALGSQTAPLVPIGSEEASGVQLHWQELKEEHYPLLSTLLSWEHDERQQRSLERRLNSAKLGRFKLLPDFDWQWPSKIDPQAVHALMQLDFLTTTRNILFIGSNGMGKSTLAQNLGYQAVMQGHTVLFTTAANLLNDLAVVDGDNALRRRLKHYARPSLLIIDEIGTLSYSNRHVCQSFSGEDETTTVRSRS